MNAEDRSDAPAASPAGHRWGPRVGIALGSVVLTCVLADFAARVLPIGPPVYQSRRIEPSGRVPFARIPNGPITYQPGSRFASVYDERPGPPYSHGRIEYQINEFGFRGPETTIEKPPGIVRVACLGDSFTFGEGVPEASPYPRRLEELLNQSSSRRCEVLNCGVQGHGTVDEFLFYRMYVARFSPDAVVLGFFLNDVMDGAETLRQNDEWTREAPDSSISRVSRIGEMIERSRRAARLQDEYFVAIRAGFHSPRWETCQRAISDLHALTAANGARLLVVIWPMLWKLDGDYPFGELHSAVRDFCKLNRIPCVDLLDCFRGLNDSALWVHPTDQHPNSDAHRMAARCIADAIESGALLRPSKP